MYVNLKLAYFMASECIIFSPSFAVPFSLTQ